jgi:zinc/manganese transport system substrate-binding protein
VRTVPIFVEEAMPALLLVLLLLAGACAGGAAVGEGSGADGGGRPRVVVTTTILGDVVKALAGDDVDVEVVMPPGVDPHAFAPSAAQAEAVRRADLLVVNGGGAEEGMHDVVEAAEADGVRVVAAVDAVATLPAVGGHDEHEDEQQADEGDEHEDEGDAVDPHVWHDPRRMADVAVALAAALAEVDGALPDAEWDERGEALAARYRHLDAEVEDLLAAVPEERRVLVTDHGSFGYLADRYGFEVVGTVVPGGDTLAEPSAADLEALVEVIRARGVPAVFADRASPSALADAVVAEAGGDVEVVLLSSDALTDADGEAATYEDLIRSNAAAIAAALTP